MFPHSFSNIPEAVSAVREAQEHLTQHHLSQLQVDQQNELAQLHLQKKLHKQEIFENEFQALTYFHDFQQEMDDRAIKIDITLRQATKMQNLDLDQEFGIERKSKNIFTKSLRSLDDRNLRMQSMLSLEKYMHGFQTQRIHTELEETDQWLRSQIKKFKIEFSQFGVNFGAHIEEEEPAVDAVMSEELDDGDDHEDDRDNDDLEEEPQEDRFEGDNPLAPGYFDVKSSSAILSGIFKKMKNAQEKWKVQSEARVEKISQQFNTRVLAINHKMRALENEIAQLHRKNGILDKELLELDKNRVVESIEQKFRSSQDTFEFQIQKQRERFQQFVKEFKLYSKYLKWMQSSDVSSPKQQKRGAKKRKGVGEGLIGDLPVDYHLENVKQEVFGVYKVFNQELETIVETREKMRNAAALESDDAKDLLQEVQTKNKFLTQDLDKKKAQLNAELQSLRQATKVATGRANSARKQCEELEDLLNRYKRKVKGKKTRTTGRSSPTKELSLSTSVPGLEHEKLWPNPLTPTPAVNSNSGDVTNTFQLSVSGSPSRPPPAASRSCSSIFEAAYLRYAKVILPNKKSKSSKKIKKSKALVPSRDVQEGFEVLFFIFADIQDHKYLQKHFLSEFSEKLRVLKRELPLYKEDESERSLCSSCQELITQLFMEAPAMLIARNELLCYRQILIHIFGLYGVIYECCLLSLDDIIPSRFHTLPIEFHEVLEKISLLVFPKIFGGYPKIDYLNLGHLPQTDTGGEGKGKKGKRGKELLRKKKQRQGDSEKSLTLLQDPLYASEIIQMMNIALTDFSASLNLFSVNPLFETLQQWVRDLMDKRIGCQVDKSWDVCSKVTSSPDQVFPITSEDRHILCGYQNLFILIAELDLCELPQNEKSDSATPSPRYQAILPSQSLESRLKAILLPAEKYPALASDSSFLLRHLLPCAIPLVVSLELIRRIHDEEITKHALLAGISESRDPNLSFLKALPTIKKAIKILTREQKRAKREEELLNSLPEEEKEYLLDTRLIISDQIQELTEIITREDESEDEEEEEIDDKDRDALNLSSSLKKSIANHLELLQETSVAEFSKDSAPKIRLMVRKFESTVAAIQLLRAKVLDVGGKFTRPYRDKLEALNAAVINQIAENSRLEKQIESLKEETGEVQNDVSTLQLTNELILKKKLTNISAELEDFLLEFDPKGDEKRDDIKSNREYLTNECDKIREMISNLKAEDQKLRENLRMIAEELSYSRSDAMVQGVHTLSSLLEQQLSQASLKSLPSQRSGKAVSLSSSSLATSASTLPSLEDSFSRPSAALSTHEEDLGESGGTNIARPKAPFLALFDPSARRNISGFGRIIVNILEFLGDGEIEQLGAMALDESIHADLLGGMKMVITEQQQQLELQRIQSLEKELLLESMERSAGEIWPPSPYSDNFEDRPEVAPAQTGLDAQVAQALRNMLAPSAVPSSVTASEIPPPRGSTGTRRPNSRTSRMLRRVIVEEGADKSVLPKLITSADLSPTRDTIVKHQQYSNHPPASSREMNYGSGSGRNMATKSVASTIRKRSVQQRPRSRPSLALLVSKDHVVSSYVGTLGAGPQADSSTSLSSASVCQIHDDSSLTPDISPSASQTVATVVVAIPPPPSAERRKSSLGVLRRSVNM